MPKKIVFDSQPLLSFFLQEEGAAKVENLINQIERGSCEGYINIVNLIELRYILARAGKDLAEESLISSGMKIIPLVVGEDIWQIAAELKASHPISLADACAAATARVLDCQLVVSADPEFKALESKNLIKIIRV
ncbi:putative PilT domain-containing protein [Candidatus Nitrososphaera gargensis Ga9.2]|uniref:Putative PilT domain-containing protein n=1 Tax=Nitrososphaera gargensis (strain Ga9.2) TaxID=1237085 RepID=K0I964_NITGG|nr:PIN domain-containing protein [Candidatus Nitrososphaera gargensis]AFU57866.1 putative PilT domain-containing protein [Candidatus Nitrososphaera gargensis Ga9.2]